MTATERIRAMLDERGVEWGELVGHPVVVGTEWHNRDGYSCTALEHADDIPDGMLSVQANLTPEQAIAATLGETPTPPPPTPPKQPPYDELIESLRRDWDIEASWDGLRRFWYVGLTDEGVRKRDEREATLGRGACEVEAENAKLRELVHCMAYCMQYERDCDECRMNGADGNIAEPCGCVGLLDRMRELGIEVDG